MPIVPTALEHQFSTLSTSDETEVKANEPVINSGMLVTPTKSELGTDDSFLSDESSEASTDSVTESNSFLTRKTDHKLKEEEGMMADEPLLKSNPHRFVIFPIQDNEVS
jgi:hypothetical protein